MPQYYFAVLGRALPETAEGELFGDDQAAWHEATLVAGEIFRDLCCDCRLEEERKLVEVRDEQRQPLFSISVTSKKLSP